MPTSPLRAASNDITGIKSVLVGKGARWLRERNATIWWKELDFWSMYPKVKKCSGAKYSSRNLTFLIYMQIYFAGKIPYITHHLLETWPKLQNGTGCLFKNVAKKKTLVLYNGCKHMRLMIGLNMTKSNRCNHCNPCVPP